MGLQRVGHNLATEQKQRTTTYSNAKIKMTAIYSLQFIFLNINSFKCSSVNYLFILNKQEEK